MDILATMQSVLKATPARWLMVAELLPVDLLTRAPAPGEWSAVGCLQHLIDVERVFQFRLTCFLEDRDFPAFDPDAEGSATTSSAPDPVALAREFDELRTESLRALGDLSPQDLTRQARHAELGLVTLEQMLHEWAGHDLMHTVQAERALMQPFIAGCGPWQVYFTDHAVPTTG